MISWLLLLSWSSLWTARGAFWQVRRSRASVGTRVPLCIPQISHIWLCTMWHFLPGCLEALFAWYGSFGWVYRIGALLAHFRVVGISTTVAGC